MVSLVSMEKFIWFSLWNHRSKSVYFSWYGFSVDGETDTNGSDTTHSRVPAPSAPISLPDPEIQIISIGYLPWRASEGLMMNTECFQQGDPAWTGSMAYCTQGHPRPTTWLASHRDVAQPPCTAVLSHINHIHMAKQAPWLFQLLWAESHPSEHYLWGIMKDLEKAGLKLSVGSFHEKATKMCTSGSQQCLVWGFLPRAVMEAMQSCAKMCVLSISLLSACFFVHRVSRVTCSDSEI